MMDKKTKNKSQMSDTLILGVVLAVAGGFMDAYSYILRDGVFANAQTGNMLLFGVYLSEGQWMLALRYFCPVISFATGIGIAEYIRYWYKKRGEDNGSPFLHWRQAALLTEITFLFAVGFMPLRMNLLANCMTSLGCGIQVESFRKIHGNAIATTMCIGNLRSAIQNLCIYESEHKKSNLQKTFLYFSIISSFVLGAVIGNAFVKRLGEKAILFCILFLLIGVTMMFMEEFDEYRIMSEKGKKGTSI